MDPSESFGIYDALFPLPVADKRAYCSSDRGCPGREKPSPAEELPVTERTL